MLLLHKCCIRLLASVFSDTALQFEIKAFPWHWIILSLIMLEQHSIGCGYITVWWKTVCKEFYWMVERHWVLLHVAGGIQCPYWYCFVRRCCSVLMARANAIISTCAWHCWTASSNAQFAEHWVGNHHALITAQREDKDVVFVPLPYAEFLSGQRWLSLSRVTHVATLFENIYNFSDLEI